MVGPGKQGKITNFFKPALREVSEFHDNEGSRTDPKKAIRKSIGNREDCSLIDDETRHYQSKLTTRNLDVRPSREIIEGRKRARDEVIVSSESDRKHTQSSLSSSQPLSIDDNPVASILHQKLRGETNIENSRPKNKHLLSNTEQSAIPWKTGVPETCFKDHQSICSSQNQAALLIRSNGNPKAIKPTSITTRKQHSLSSDDLMMSSVQDVLNQSDFPINNNYIAKPNDRVQKFDGPSLEIPGGTSSSENQADIQLFGALISGSPMLVRKNQEADTSVDTISNDISEDQLCKINTLLPGDKDYVLSSDPLVKIQERRYPVIAIQNSRKQEMDSEEDIILRTISKSRSNNNRLVSESEDDVSLCEPDSSDDETWMTKPLNT